MLLITCPVTGTDELVADRRIRSVTNHPTHVAMAVECPACGSVHVYRTGRRWEEARRRVADATATAAADATATAAATAADTRIGTSVSTPAGTARAATAAAASARAAQELTLA